MYHFFAEHKNIYDNYIVIEGDDVNHIKNVVRLKKGDEIIISSGDNVDYYCVISDITSEKVIADIKKTDTKGHELPSKIYLFQGLPKADKMELIVQKAVELGAYEIIPVSMKRSVVKLDEKKAQAKVKRWNTIANSAAKQSKRSIVPQVSEVMTFKQAMEYIKNIDLKLLPYECADGIEKTRSIISDLIPGQSIAIFIGPEGGFDLNELELAKSNGCEIITLGKRILRTETAGMMLLSVLMMRLED